MIGDSTSFLGITCSTLFSTSSLFTITETCELEQLGVVWRTDEREVEETLCSTLIGVVLNEVGRGFLLLELAGCATLTTGTPVIAKWV
jgi:hypothetical protein